MLNFLHPSTPMPSPPQSPGLNLAPFQWLPAGVAFFRRRMRPIVWCGLLGLVVGVICLTTATPLYTAVATLTIDTHSQRTVGTQPSSTDWQAESAYIESQAELIQSPATLRGVVANLHLDRDPRFAPSNSGPIAQFVTAAKRLLPTFGARDVGLDPAARAQAMAGAALSRMLQVWRIGTTSVVEVRVRTPDRALSAQLANAVTEAYMAQQLVAVSDTTHRAGAWLQSRVGDLRGQAVDADRAVQEYKAKNDIVDVSTGSGIGLMNEQQLGELNVQVANARSRLAGAQARLEQAQAGSVEGVAHGQGSVGQGVVADGPQNAVMLGLRQQYLDASRREADLVARMGPTHGAVILQHKVVAELEHSIQSELAHETEADRAEYQVAQAGLDAIQARLTEQVAAAAQTNIKRSELRSLQSSADAYRQIYENFLQRFTQAMQDQSYPISDARVAAPALPPMERSYPRTSITLAVALALGLTLGVVIAVTGEALDVTVRTIAQLRQATGFDCLGTVSETKDLVCRPSRSWRRAKRTGDLRGQTRVPNAFRQAAVNPESSIAEAVHGVRVAAARQSALGRDVRVIGCVSMLGGEGTSTFAANLAFALAADGQRTALLDWNTKSPWLTEILSPGPRIGVQELMAHEATLHEACLSDMETGLCFVGQSRTGTRRAKPAATKVRSMLAELRDRHDVVVIDLPPLHAGGAAALLSDMVDGFVLVARWGATPQPVLSETLSRTATMDALFLGAVLTHCDAPRMRLYLGDATQTQMARAPLPATTGA
jgi:succinoglycan biosynthesis transport protein ExoP